MRDWVLAQTPTDPEVEERGEGGPQERIAAPGTGQSPAGVDQPKAQPNPAAKAYQVAITTW